MGHHDTVALTFGLSIQHIEQTSEVSSPIPARRASEGLEPSLTLRASEQLAAVDLLNLCAFLAPDDIPRSLFAQGGAHLPARLAAVVSDELELNRVLKLLRSYSLIELTADSLSVHRLVQAVCRDRLANVGRQPPGLATARDNQGADAPRSPQGSPRKHVATQRFAAAAVKMINNAFPEDLLTNLATWPIIQGLLPYAKSAATHANGFGIELAATGRLLNHVGIYLQIRT